MPFTSLGGGAGTFVGCRLTKSANQTISASATTAVSFDGEAFDTDGLHDNATNNTRITNTLGVTAHFLVGGAVQFDTEQGDGSQILLRVNGSTQIPGGYRLYSSAANAAGMILPTTLVELAANDYVEMVIVNGDAGGTIVVRGGASSPVYASFWATALG